MTRFEFGKLRDTVELEDFAKIAAWAFSFPPAQALEWLTRAGTENVRLVRTQGKVAAGLVELGLGQWFGGKSVSMLGIAGVAVAPDARGHGIAKYMMRESLLGARQNGFALSTLYPATLTLYRALGYELAGCYCRYNLRAADCPRSRDAIELRVVGEDDRLPIQNSFTDLARTRNGYLDRSAGLWQRITHPQGETAVGMVAVGQAGLEGYLYVTQRKLGSGSDLLVSDFVAHTPAACHGLLRFLADHRSTIESITWHGGVQDARVFAFPERRYSLSLDKDWMLRIVNVEKALLERGYPAIDWDLAFEVSDPVLEANSGSYHLSLRSGKPSVERRSSKNALRLDVRALAAMYTGYASAHELARAGLVQGDAATLDGAAVLFAGPHPVLSDFF